MLISPEEECKSILTVLLMKSRIFERHVLSNETIEQRIISIKNLVQLTQAVINRLNVLYHYLPKGDLMEKILLSLPIMQMSVDMMNGNLKRFEDGTFF